MSNSCPNCNPLPDNHAAPGHAYFCCQECEDAWKAAEALKSMGEQSDGHLTLEDMNRAVERMRDMGSEPDMIIMHPSALKKLQMYLYGSTSASGHGAGFSDSTFGGYAIHTAYGRTPDCVSVLDKNKKAVCGCKED